MPYSNIDWAWIASVSPVVLVLLTIALRSLRLRIQARKQQTTQTTPETSGEPQAKPLDLVMAPEAPPAPVEPPGYWAKPGDSAYALQQAMKDVCEQGRAPDSLGDYARAVYRNPDTPVPPAPVGNSLHITYDEAGVSKLDYARQRGGDGDLVVNDAGSVTAKAAEEQRKTDMLHNQIRKRGLDPETTGPGGTKIIPMTSAEVSRRLAADANYARTLNARVADKLKEVRAVGETFAREKLLTVEKRQALIASGGLTAVEEFVKAAGEEAVKLHVTRCREMTKLPLDADETPMFRDGQPRDESKYGEPGAFWKGRFDEAFMRPSGLETEGK